MACHKACAASKGTALPQSTLRAYAFPFFFPFHHMLLSRRTDVHPHAGMRNFSVAMYLPYNYQAGSRQLPGTFACWRAWPLLHAC